MEKAGEILKRILDKDSAVMAKYYNSLFNSWYDIAQEPLAAHSYIADIESNQLVVIVDHPGWLQLFHFNEHKILKRIKEKYPELAIRAIKIRIEPNTSHIHRDSELNATEPINQTDVHNPVNEEPIFENIKDKELHKIFINLYKNVVDKK